MVEKKLQKVSVACSFLVSFRRKRERGPAGGQSRALGAGSGEDMGKIHYWRRFFGGLAVALRVMASYRTAGLMGFFMSGEEKAAYLKHLHRRNAVLIRETAIRMKGLMIKVGQFLSSRIDFLPDEYIRELSQLQDNVPPHAYDEIRRQIIADLGAAPEELFSRFDAEPIAAASLSQVHRAVLQDGRTVAVKVQYPGIEKVIETDIKTLRTLITLLQGRYGRIDLKVLHGEFARIVRAELDYGQEGRNAERFAGNFKGDERIIIPAVLREYSGKRVLTLEFVEGVKITECGPEKTPGIDCEEVANLLAETYARMIFLHGFFHGDPHPGNILIREGPKLVFVDFGMVQEIPEKTRRDLRRFANAIVERNTPRIIDSMERMGFITEGADYGALLEVAQALIDKYRYITPRELKALTVDDIAGEIERIFSVIDYLQIPNNFILLGRAVGMLNGIAFQLNPSLNIIEIGKPYIREFLMGSRSEQAERVWESLRERVLTLWRLPSQVEEFLMKAGKGELSFKLPKSEIDMITSQFKVMTNVMMLVILTVTAASAALFFVLIGSETLTLTAASVSILLGLLSVYRLMKG
ncbi:MAG: AarF/UbiB family protein [Thermodesulfovibrionales bacterium]